MAGSQLSSNESFAPALMNREQQVTHSEVSSGRLHRLADLQLHFHQSVAE